MNATIEEVCSVCGIKTVLRCSNCKTIMCIVCKCSCGGDDSSAEQMFRKLCRDIEREGVACIRQGTDYAPGMAYKLRQISDMCIVRGWVTASEICREYDHHDMAKTPKEIAAAEHNVTVIRPVHTWG